MKSNLIEQAGILVVALVVRFGLLYHAVFVTSSELVHDAVVWVFLGRALRGAIGPEYMERFLYRPIGYPALLALVQGTLGDDTLTFSAVNIVISSVTCLVGYHVARHLGRHARVPLLAGLILAVDPGHAGTSLLVAAEPLANLFLGLSLLHLAILCERPKWQHAFFSGLWLALSILTRPNAVYLWIFVGVAFWLLVRRWKRYYALYAAVPIVTILAWSSVNYLINNVYTYSTVGTFNLLFYRAVVVERWATGASDDLLRRQYSYELEQRLGTGVEWDAIDSGYFWWNLLPESRARLDLMGTKAREVFLAYPLWFFLTAPISVYYMLAHRSGIPPYPLPGLDLVFPWVMYALAVAGLWSSWREKNTRLVVVSLTVIGYFVAIILYSGGPNGIRVRTSFDILLAILAAQGLVWLWKLRRRRPI